MLVKSGDNGVLMTSLATATGRKGKATRSAAIAALTRVGLLNEGGADPFVNVRIGTKRAVKLNDKAQVSAQKLLDQDQD